MGCISGYRFYTISTTLTIAKASIYITHSIFVRSRQQTTTYRLKRRVNSSWLQESGFVYNVLQFASVTRHSVQTMWTMFSRKDFFRFFDGLLQISPGKTKAEPRCLTLLGGHDGAICAVKHLELVLELVHAHHLVNPYMDLTTSIWGTKY